ncbi:hypothetical protein Golob_025488, partial [Gossypium lobatum]|nr:hypothetical protein [Gossypium lobatum]
MEGEFSTTTHIWDILDGLILLLDQDYDSVMIYIDSLEIVKAIQDSSSSGSNFALVRRIHQLLTKVKHWSPWHISREDNNDVNDLTKWSKIEGKDYGCLRTLFVGADLVL